ncbi:hypothetical protein B0A48_03556 [Cryoendolithus antarcticus]|uniref:Ubiquitin-like domain-containing protein n=1 Tax=Cryoendolithus antarcticus TaxID=1507870 RepID=A0A1V8TKD3_9PEZI|nr:hypothetical protein B0A48_03556 [Cryoendolithus antarcticus]
MVSPLTDDAMLHAKLTSYGGGYLGRKGQRIHDGLFISRQGKPDEYSQRLHISFKRTIRVSDNDGTADLPPDLGNFPLYDVSKYSETLSEDVSVKGGYFFPMYQREAMWINLSSQDPFAIKVFVGGVNAISGEAALETEQTLLKRERLLAQSKRIQDYVVTPKQKWLDGIASDDGTVRQFVAMPIGSGYSIEAQITGTDQISGLQIEVTPSKIRKMPLLRNTYVPVGGATSSHTICIKDLCARVWTFEVDAFHLVDHVKGYMETAAGIPMDQQRMIYAGKQMEDGRLLSDYSISEVDLSIGYLGVSIDSVQGATLHLVLRLRGGGGDDTHRASAGAATQATMSVAAGGLIKQSIRLDKHDPKIWEPESGIILSFSILNSEAFKTVTGEEPPETPITAATYAKYGLPYYSLLDETPSGIYGNFSEIASVATKDGTGTQTEEKTQAAVEVAKSTKNPVVSLDADGQRVGFRPVSKMKEEVREMVLAVRERKAAVEVKVEA